jgi:HEAT repeat protein
LPDEAHINRTATALAALRRALEDPVVEVRREAALALGQLGDVDSVSTLAEALASDGEPVRRAAALALGRVSTLEAREALLRALREDRSVWREVAVALSRHNDPEVVDGLNGLLADPAADEHTRRGAALALGALLSGESLAMETAIGPTAFEDEQGRLHVML